MRYDEAFAVQPTIKTQDNEKIEVGWLPERNCHQFDLKLKKGEWPMTMAINIKSKFNGETVPAYIGRRGPWLEMLVDCHSRNQPDIGNCSSP